MDKCFLFSNYSSELNLLSDKGSDRSQKLSDALFSCFCQSFYRELCYSVNTFLIFGGLFIKSLSFLFWFNCQCTCLFGYYSRLSNQPFQNHDEQQQRFKKIYKARSNRDS